jgi:hypothetical protein
MSTPVEDCGVVSFFVECLVFLFLCFSVVVRDRPVEVYAVVMNLRCVQAELRWRVAHFGSR